MIEITNITKSYGQITALNDISFKIGNSEFFGLLGPNGAGKSTTMSLIIGYLKPDKGKILIDSEEINSNNAKFRQKIGFVPQSIALYDDLSAEANLEIFGNLYNISKSKLKEIVKEKLNSVGLYERRKYLVKTFSGGMKRRLNIIASLLHNPDTILCDEPTVGVDPQSRNSIFEYLVKLNKEGKTIIYSTHYMEEAEKMCSRLAIIDNGKIIAEGTLNSLLNLLPFEENIKIHQKELNENERIELTEFGDIIFEENVFTIKLKRGLPLSDAIKIIEKLKINNNQIEISRPSLESLFLHLTGRRLRD